ncbi:winged helix-turn-helix domain-containing protein [Nocardiopsis sp. FR26]|uniref:GntR family transcriptional regulator n=1 Tax=Nocardiopsis sp. FR26 TaxID=2605987 RepID=UPI00135C394B|nr:winged helix-turn-helix domain-containing protein [Nocardiopsis sp. FR26]
MYEQIGADAEIDHEGPQAPYLQLVEILVARIRRGDWDQGRPIASETRLVQEYGLARSTVRRSIKVLAQEGWVHVVPHRGTYVARTSDEQEQEQE